MRRSVPWNSTEMRNGHIEQELPQSSRSGSGNRTRDASGGFRTGARGGIPTCFRCRAAPPPSWPGSWGLGSHRSDCGGQPAKAAGARGVVRSSFLPSVRRGSSRSNVLVNEALTPPVLVYLQPDKEDLFLLNPPPPPPPPLSPRTDEQTILRRQLPL